VADEAVTRIGAILEELSARFELVVEAVTGFGGRVDALRDELFGQFAEVGGQVRFLSEQIAESRRGVAIVREDLGAEIVRIGEALGKARVEFRDGLAALQSADGQAAGTDRDGATLHAQLADTTKVIKREIASSAESSAKKLSTELKQTGKALADLARKFERFDDRITIQTRDQDQRLRKLERKRAG
jgi:phage-related minor tail protein